ncbi:hypothetical protein VTI74DRAFT_3518 [Chaetomium olivicolor]
MQGGAIWHDVVRPNYVRKALNEMSDLLFPMLHLPKNYPVRQEGGGDIRILEVLLHHRSQQLRNGAKVDGLDGIRAGIDDEFTPTFMGNEHWTESLGISVNKES